MAKSAEQIVLAELNRREEEKGSGIVHKHMGISRAFEEPVITDDMTDGEKIHAHLFRKPKASEEDIAKEVLRVHDELASKSPDQLRKEQLTYVYEDLQKAFKAVSYDRFGAYKDPPIQETTEQLEARLTEAWGCIEMAMLLLGNYVDRKALYKDV